MLLAAITNKQGHILQQMKQAAEANRKELLVLENFFEVLIYSTWDEEPTRAEILTDAKLYNALTQGS